MTTAIITAPSTITDRPTITERPTITGHLSAGTNHGPGSSADDFAETWRRATAANTEIPHERPAYPEPPTADAGPPRDAIAADVVKLLDAGGGRETIIARDARGRELRFTRDGLFRWATRTAETIVVEPGIRDDPRPRRLWVRNVATGTWWTDSAHAQRVAWQGSSRRDRSAAAVLFSAC